MGANEEADPQKIPSAIHEPAKWLDFPLPLRTRHRTSCHVRPRWAPLIGQVWGLSGRRNIVAPLIPLILRRISSTCNHRSPGSRLQGRPQGYAL